MRIICAPDSFKESLSAQDAAASMARGIKRALPDAVVDQCPVADGGEGTVDALVAATGGHSRHTIVQGPLGQDVDAAWGMLGSPADSDAPGNSPGDSPGAIPGNPPGSSPGDFAGIAVIEMAAASGLPLVPQAKRDPTATSTYGTGQLIAAALNQGARRILLGIGGSATNDGGCGMAQALGVRFIMANGQGVPAPITGAMLSEIERIDTSAIDPRVAEARFTVACDVTNPLTGPDGAAAVYGPQKGATPQQLDQLDQGLAHLARCVKQQLHIDIEKLPGSGAAGGLGGGLVAFTGATLTQGIELVLGAVEFEKRVADCDLCLTGEGRLDGSSLSGKACLGVARAARRHHVPTIALVGSLGANCRRTLDAGLSAYYAIGQGLAVEDSIKQADALLEQYTFDVVRDQSRWSM